MKTLAEYPASVARMALEALGRGEGITDPELDAAARAHMREALDAERRCKLKAALLKLRLDPKGEHPHHVRELAQGWANAAPLAARGELFELLRLWDEGGDLDALHGAVELRKRLADGGGEESRAVVFGSVVLAYFDRRGEWPAIGAAREIAADVCQRLDLGGDISTKEWRRIEKRVGVDWLEPGKGGRPRQNG